MAPSLLRPLLLLHQHLPQPLSEHPLQHLPQLQLQLLQPLPR